MRGVIPMFDQIFVCAALKAQDNPMRMTTYTIVLAIVQRCLSCAPFFNLLFILSIIFSAKALLRYGY